MGVTNAALELETHRSNAERSARQLRFLAVHEDGTGLLAIRKVMKLIIQAEVIGARSSAAALERLAGEEPFDGILLHWALPGREALNLASDLAQQEVSGPRPVLMAFAHQWPTDDLARALQLGVEAVLALPVNPLAVERELSTHERSGRSSSVRRLLSKVGDGLLRPNPALWEFDDDEVAPWKVRMQSLAQASRRVAEPGEVGRWAAQVVRAVDRANGSPIGPLMGAGIASVNADGTDALLEIARGLCVSHARLRRLFTAAGAALAACGIPRRTDSAAQQVMATVAKDAAQRPELVPWSETYEPMRRAAVAVYEAPSITSSAAVFLCRRLAELLSVEPEQIAIFGPDNLRRVAAHIVDQLSERRALDLARLTILACSLKGVAEMPREKREIDTDRLRVVRGALSGEPGQAHRIMELATGELGLDLDLVTRELVEVVERVMAECAENADGATVTDALVAQLSVAEKTPAPTSPEDLAALVGANRLDQALTAAERLDDEHPRSVPLMDRLANALLETGRAAEGLPLIERAVRLRPKRLPLYLTLARLALAGADYAKARAALEHLELRAPGFGDSAELRSQLEARADPAPVS